MAECTCRRPGHWRRAPENPSDSYRSGKLDRDHRRHRYRRLQRTSRMPAIARDFLFLTARIITILTTVIAVSGRNTLASWMGTFFHVAHDYLRIYEIHQASNGPKLAKLFFPRQELTHPSPPTTSLQSRVSNADDPRDRRRREPARHHWRDARTGRLSRRPGGRRHDRASTRPSPSSPTSCWSTCACPA